ncbi:hypothetical protein Xoosp13_54 [Xanthomonas phage Xoo-sp13]|nr:hypothetical protein Xoosp13_54 [Xanthomonas phage Xoo-sp13]
MDVIVVKRLHNGITFHQAIHPRTWQVTLNFVVIHIENDKMLFKRIQANLALNIATTPFTKDGVTMLACVVKVQCNICNQVMECNFTPRHIMGKACIVLFNADKVFTALCLHLILIHTDTSISSMQLHRTFVFDGRNRLAVIGTVLTHSLDDMAELFNRAKLLHNVLCRLE